MFNNYIFFVVHVMRSQNVEYASFMQKLVEFDFIYFQLNYERVMRFRMSNMYVWMTTINFRNQLAILNFFDFFFSSFILNLSWRSTNEIHSRCHFMMKTFERRQNKIVCFFYYLINHFVAFDICVIENLMKL